LERIRGRGDLGKIRVGGIIPDGRAEEMGGVGHNNRGKGNLKE